MAFSHAPALPDVHRLQVLPHQPEQHRAVGGMAAPGEREQAVERCASMRATDSSRPASASARTKRGTRIGPTVCELDGPIPTLNRSKTLTGMGCAYASGENAAGDRNTLSWWTR